MNKFFDYTKQVFKGKSLGRILFNWLVFKYAQDLKGRGLDLAGGNSPSYLKYLPKEGIEIARTDFEEGQNIDRVVDLNKELDFEDSSMDFVFLFNFLYIIKKPEELISEIYRILKKDGQLLVSSPFMFNEAPEPDDFRRLTSQGLKELFSQAGFKKIEIIPYGERFSVTVSLINPFLLFNFIRFFAYGKALLFDKLIPRKIKEKHSCPLAYFVIVKK